MWSAGLRRRKSAAERRAQRERADARFLNRVLRLAHLQHRGHQVGLQLRQFACSLEPGRPGPLGSDHEQRGQEHEGQHEMGSPEEPELGHGSAGGFHASRGPDEPDVIDRLPPVEVGAICTGVVGGTRPVDVDADEGSAACRDRLHDLQLAVSRLPLFPTTAHCEQLRDLDRLVASLADVPDAAALCERSTALIARKRQQLDMLVVWRGKITGLQEEQLQAARGDWIIAHRQRHGASCALPKFLGSQRAFLNFCQGLVADERESTAALSRYLHSNLGILSSWYSES